MRQELEKWMASKMQRFAPRTVQNLQSISRWDAEYEENGPRIVLYERDLRDLRREVDAIRTEQRRVVELYDAVFEYVRANGGTLPGRDARDALRPEPGDGAAGETDDETGRVEGDASP